MSRAITGTRAARWSPEQPVAALPFGMEGSAGAVVDGDDDHAALFRALNYFPTPPWAARAGGELIRMLDPDAACIWEPACGEGHMAGPLREIFAEVIASDIHPFGFGGVMDFLDPLAPSGVGPERLVDWVATNPPFSKAEAFVRRGLSIARRGVAVLCRVAFVESVGRYPLMRDMAVMAPFAERVPMQMGSWDPDLSSATAYCWFVWMQPAAIDASPMGDAIRAAQSQGGCLLRVIAPGQCERLTRLDDRIVYAGETASPQLEMAGLG